VLLSHYQCLLKLTELKKKSKEEIYQIIEKNFDLRPGVIRKELDLRRAIYAKTASYGHFGREDPDFLWEKPKKLKL